MPRKKKAYPPGISLYEGKRGDRLTAEVRRVGFPTQVQYFDRETDAVKWRRSVLAKIEAGKFRDESQTRKHTLSELIDRYVDEVLPLKEPGKVQFH